MNSFNEKSKKIALLLGVYKPSYLRVKKTYEMWYNIIAIHDEMCIDSADFKNIKQYIKNFFCVSFNDYQSIGKIAKSQGVSLVIPHPCTGDSLIACGFVNTFLCLKGVQFKSAKICWSKEHFALFLKRYNFSRPKQTYAVHWERDFSDVIFPCIVKPNYGVWSIWVKKIDNLEELSSFFHDKKEDNGYKLINPNDYYLVQTYVWARYFWINGIIQDGNLQIFNWWDLLSDWWNSPYRYGESYITSYKKLSTSAIHEIKDFFQKIWLKNCPFMLELLVDEDMNIEIFIEVNLRPAGMNSSYAFDSIYWFDNVWDQIKLVIESNTDVLLEKRPCVFQYILLKNFKFKPWKIRSISWPDTSENILYFDSNLQIGDEIKECINTIVAAKNGQIAAIWKTSEEVQNLVNNFSNNINIQYE